MVSRLAGWVVLLVACVAPLVEQNAMADDLISGVPFDAKSCKADIDGKMYIAFLRLVFAFPAGENIGGDPDFPSTERTTRVDPAPTRVELYPIRPKPPNTAEPEGCPGHPAQRFTYTLDGRALTDLMETVPAAKLGNAAAGHEKLTGDSASLSATQPGHDNIGGDFGLPSTYSKTDYCGPLDADMMRQKNTGLRCLYRSDNGTGGWFGRGRTRPFLGVVTEPAHMFECRDNICSVRAIFEPGLFVRYVHQLDSSSPLSPIDQMTAVHHELWTALYAAQVLHFPWP
jgi:hypothetical protein